MIQFASIRYNIQYGRVNATDEEIYEAARAADIHDRILGFPDAYDTGNFTLYKSFKGKTITNLNFPFQS